MMINWFVSIVVGLSIMTLMIGAFWLNMTKEVPGTWNMLLGLVEFLIITIWFIMPMAFPEEAKLIGSSYDGDLGIKVYGASNTGKSYAALKIFEETMVEVEVKQ